MKCGVFMVKDKKIIPSIANIFSRIYDFAVIVAIVMFFFGGANIAFFIFLYGGSFYVLFFCLKLIANEKKNKKITYLGIFLIIVFTIMTVFNVVMSIRWIGR